MVARGRTEIPDPRLAVAGEQAPARELVARPLPDDGAGEIADVVLVEHEERAEAGARQRLARAPEAIGVETMEVHALLEVHLRVTGRLQRPVPAMARIHVVGGHRASPGRVLLAGHGGSPLHGAVLYLSLR